MTQKQIIALAANEEAMEMLKKIAEIQSNMESKTVYEQKTAKNEMKQTTKDILAIINE